MSEIALLKRFLAAYKFTLSLDDVCANAALSSLSELGLVQFRESGATGICDACDLNHTVKFEIDPVANKLGWRCPAIGFVEASTEQLKTARFMPDVLASLIGSSLQCQRRKPVPLAENLLWNVGWYEFQANDLNIYLASRIRDTEDVGVIARALRAEPSLRNGLLIAPDVSSVADLTVSGCRIAAIDDVITIRGNALSTDQSRVAELAGVLINETRGRPSIFQPMLNDLISERDASGGAARTVKGEARAIRVLWPEQFPSINTPGKTTVENAIRAFQEVNKGQ